MPLRLMSFLSILLIGLSPTVAEATDKGNITLQNDQVFPSAALLVVVYDMNTPEQMKVFSSSIDPGQPVSVDVKFAEEKAHVRWEAQSSDRQRCGSGDVTLGLGGTVSLRSPAQC